MSLWKTLIATTIILMAGSALAQDWGPMQEIYWHNPPHFNLPGTFNPSFCDSDSILYFDDFLRFFFAYGVIYSSTLLGKDEYGQLEWTDPVALPVPINIPGYLSACPGITASGDTLFFSSNRPGTRGGMDIWMSIKDDTLWSEPINLGDSINSETDELKPYYVSDDRILFFDRLENIHTYLYALYNSNLNDNNEWQSAVRLPAIINRPDTGSYSAFYNQYDNSLYFTSSNPADPNLAIYKSAYRIGIWDTPLLLEENINGFWFPNDCNRHETENGWMTANRRLFFFDKMIWDVGCTDFGAMLFYSEMNTSIDHTTEQSNSDNDIIIYPNPSNSDFVISLNSNHELGTLSIYNLTGQLIDRRAIAPYMSTIIWSTSNTKNNISSGIYFVQVEISKQKVTRKLVFIK
jgi:hypothetical protein